MIWDRIVMTLRGLRWLLLGGMLFLAVPAVAQAANVTVTNTNDSGSGSLRDAIATPGVTTIDFAPGLTGTITLTGGVLSITQSVTITGPGAGTITVSGGHTTPVFDLAPSVANQDFTISGLTITGGSASTNGGGILANDLVRTLTLNSDTISSNQVSITNPAGASGGGGVYINGGTLVVNSSTITGNSVTLTGPASGTGGGGGLYDNGGSITVTGSDVSHNTVNQGASSGASGGGGIYSNGGDVGVDTSMVDNNSDSVNSGTGTSDGGGGIYSNGGTVTLSAARVDANGFTLTSSTGGFNGGGGVYSNGGTVGGVFSSISQNTATVSANGNNNGGGAIYDDGGGGAYLASTLSGNSVSLSGSGTQNNGGGAIYSFGANRIIDLTIAGNSINAPGGGLFSSSGGGFALEDTIVADNTNGNCGGAGTFQSAGFNLESANTCRLTGSGDQINTEPKLGPLQNNGGPTPTQALLAGSPAIDAGSCTSTLLGSPVPTDQRGVARPQPSGGKCDIGAFELVPSGSNPPPSPAPPPPSPPAALPGQPAATSATAAGFSASVNPEGQTTTVFFQYGLDSRYRPGGGAAVVYDQSTPPQTLPADTAPHAVSASATGLVPNAVYHVRLVATNATGTTFGPDQTFTTPAGPAPPPPVLGQTVNAKPVSGQVFVLIAGKLVPLTQGEQIPSGSILDARAGSLQLTTATGAGHKTQTGVFGGAIFKLTQARGGAGRGLTTLALVEGAFSGAPSYATCKAHKAGDASAAAASTNTLQLLRASAHGKFRTSGRYSAATVRGTRWTIADRCDGTLTHDLTDSVAVTDFVRHKTIVLHAGQSYLARARQTHPHK